MYRLQSTETTEDKDGDRRLVARGTRGCLFFPPKQHPAVQGDAWREAGRYQAICGWKSSTTFIELFYYTYSFWALFYLKTLYSLIDIHFICFCVLMMLMHANNTQVMQLKKATHCLILATMKP